MSGGNRTRVIKFIAAGAGTAVVLSGVAFALVNAGADEGPSRPRARAAPGSSSPSSSSPSSSAVTSTSTTSASTTTTVAPETTTTTAPPQPDGSLLALQQRLAELGYDVGTPDGVAGWRTYYAIAAFQRVEGLARTGEENEEVRAALPNATRPGPVVPGGESDRVEIDLNRQLLLLWRGGELARILPVSTGNGEEYCVDGVCDVAVTPTGTFRIGRKYDGLEVSRLGELYHPMYFYGGIAIHGSPSIPGYPASHGCVRVPMYASGSLYQQVPGGTAVYVVGDGPAATDVPPPPDEPVRLPAPPVLPEPEPQPDTATSTSVPEPSEATTTTTTVS